MVTNRNFLVSWGVCEGCELSRILLFVSFIYMSTLTLLLGSVPMWGHLLLRTPLQKMQLEDVLGNTSIVHQHIVLVKNEITWDLPTAQLAHTSCLSMLSS